MEIFTSTETIVIIKVSSIVGNPASTKIDLIIKTFFFVRKLIIIYFGFIRIYSLNHKSDIFFSYAFVVSTFRNLIFAHFPCVNQCRFPDCLNINF